MRVIPLGWKQRANHSSRYTFSKIRRGDGRRIDQFAGTTHSTRGRKIAAAHFCADVAGDLVAVGR